MAHAIPRGVPIHGSGACSAPSSSEVAADRGSISPSSASSTQQSSPASSRVTRQPVTPVSASPHCCSTHATSLIPTRFRSSYLVGAALGAVGVPLGA